MPILARAWQVLLKGLEEAAEAPNAMAAAEMVLIRLAYTADLPPPDEIIKALGGGAVSRTQPAARASAAAAPPTPPVAPREPVETAMQAPQPAIAVAGGPEPHAATNGIEAGVEDSDIDAEGSEDLDDLGDAAPAAPGLRSFMDVVELVGARRDVKLKDHLERNVSLVSFDPEGSIELYLFPGAPKELPSELRQKLKLWTGRTWVVSVSKVPGERTIDEVRSEREAAEQIEIENHPAVAAVLQQFPNAKVKVKPLPGAKL
jgi:DNA polymerase-3 subunit gamma/tau